MSKVKFALCTLALLPLAAIAQTVAPDPATIVNGVEDLYNDAATIGVAVVVLGAGIAFVMKGLYLKRR